MASPAKKPRPSVRKDVNKPLTDEVDVHGRPIKYKPEMDGHVHGLALLGCTQDEMARFFEVALSTLQRWLVSYPSFQSAMRAGGEEADINVVKSLYRQATGYEIETEEAKVVQVDRFQQKVEIVKVVRQVPPDYRATGRFLGNRRRGSRWDESQDQGSNTPPEDAARAAQAAIAAADKVIDE